MAKETMVIPDLGGVDEVTVLEVLVQVGDVIEADQAVMSLESEKASMDVPSEKKAKVMEILLSPGDRVKEGDACLVLQSCQEENQKNEEESDDQKTQIEKKDVINAENIQESKNFNIDIKRSIQADKVGTRDKVSASPGVRKLARTLGIDTQSVVGSGRFGRVTFDDIAKTVLSRMGNLGDNQTINTKGNTSQNPGKFGPCHKKELGKIKKATVKAMEKSWANVVHVTQFEKADITELEAFRVLHKDSLKAQSVRLTMLAFIIKAMAQALIKHPHINSSLDEQGQNLWIKEYYHIGFAVDTPNGLVVPVICDVDGLSVIDIAKKLAEISEKARHSQLTPKDMVGGSMTVSSLGGIGGRYFTPIVNQPQSAILGVSRSVKEAIWDGDTFRPRLMLPLSLSYDHRVIDGAEAMRFLNDLIECLQKLHGKSLSKVD